MILLNHDERLAEFIGELSDANEALQGDHEHLLKVQEWIEKDKENITYWQDKIKSLGAEVPQTNE